MRRRRSRVTGKSALTGWAVLVYVFLYVPILLVVVFAFNKSSLPVLPITGWSTHWFHQAFSNTDLTGAAWRSLQLAVVNGIITRSS